MPRPISRWRILASLALVAACLALACLTVASVRRQQWAGLPTFPVEAAFRSVGGIEPGTRVRLQGINAGTVDAIVPPDRPGGPVLVRFRVDETLKGLVRADASVRIVPVGVIGQKVLEVVPGRPDAPALDARGRLRAEDPVEIADLIVDARSTLRRVDAAAKSAEEGLAEVQQIAVSIREGKGTVGKLVNDDEAYRKLLALSDRGTKTVDDLGDNLAALKRTWPLSRYFNGQGFFDRDQVLYRPGSDRESRTIRADDLFEPGRAILTATGKRRLDELAGWLDRAKRPTSEVVIAAFADDTPDTDPDMSRILTQEQADAVRAYMVKRHKLDSVGWFGTRKVAAIGFGAEPPRPELVSRGVAGRRVELILFTPRA